MPKIKKRSTSIVSALIFISGLVMSSSVAAHAITAVVDGEGARHPVAVLSPTTPDPLLDRIGVDESPQLIRVTLNKAQKLLKIKKNQTMLWRVMGVEAPTLGQGAPSATKTQRRLNAKNKVECQKAEKFAQKYSRHATCSELYLKTTVLLAPTSIR